MNNKQVIALCLLAFVLGDTEAVFRSKKINKQLNKKLEILKLRNELACWVIEEAPFLDSEERETVYNEKTSFIRIVVKEGL